MFKINVSLIGACLLALVATGCAGPSPGDQTGGRNAGSAALTPQPAQAPRVVVYYMHRTFRCFSCLWLEKTTRQTLDETFPSELASGRLELRVVDFWQRKDLAERYGVDTVAIVVVNMDRDREVSHKTLEKVWGLKGKTNEFHAYVAEAVKAALTKANAS